MKKLLLVWIIALVLLPVISQAGMTKACDQGSCKVDVAEDIIIDLATKGLVLKDTQGTPHYWRITVENDGSLKTTDLGTEKP